MDRASLPSVRRLFKFTSPDPTGGDDDEIVLMWRVRRGPDGRKWLGLPRGRPDLVAKCLRGGMDLDSFVDMQAAPGADIDLRFNGAYRDFQRPAIIDLADSDRGVLVSRPRSGKTVMGAAAIVERQMKTLILAHQADLVEQFCNETINDADGKLFDGADFDPPLAAVCSKLSDFRRHPICLATWQTFLSPKGRKLLAAIKDMFGVVLVDEVHRSPSKCYSQVLTRFSARCMWGLTATPDRKDGLWQVADRTIGPIVHSTDADVLKPVVGLHDTTGKLPDLPKDQPETFNGIVNMLAECESRNRRIAKLAVRQIEKGHTVLVPVVRVGQAAALADLIDEEWGDKAAFQFTGAIPKAKRQAARDRMNDDESIKAVLATRSMLPGMNIPRWSSLISQALIANEPAYEQEVFRVCTPMEGKPRPIITYVFDGDASISWPFLFKCAKTLMNPKFGFEPTRMYAAYVGRR